MNDRSAYLGNENYGVVLEFLRGSRPDWQGRQLDDILRQDDIWLEEDHHYIQWLFPLLVESEAVFAPVIRRYELAELRDDQRAQEVMLRSLNRLLEFFGLVLDQSDGKLVVSRSERFEERKPVWITPGNHNYRRISRILGSLVLAGLKPYAEAFLMGLEALESEEIESTALWYWRQSVRA